eukprot:5774636-Prymnesium_polylepis.1
MVDHRWTLGLWLTLRRGIDFMTECHRRMVLRSTADCGFTDSFAANCASPSRRISPPLSETAMVL